MCVFHFCNQTENTKWSECEERTKNKYSNNTSQTVSTIHSCWKNQCALFDLLSLTKPPTTKSMPNSIASFSPLNQCRLVEKIVINTLLSSQIGAAKKDRTTKIKRPVNAYCVLNSTSDKNTLLGVCDLRVCHNFPIFCAWFWLKSMHCTWI